MTFICNQGPTIPLSDEQAKAISDDINNPMNYCCYGSASNGPTHCECWVAEYSDDRQKPKGGDMQLRVTQCQDCAYRHDSAEWNDPVERAKLIAHALGDGVFSCHQGTPYVVRWRHPEGMVIEAERDAAGNINTYEPLIIGSTPFKANGEPADLCAGYATRRLQYMGKDQECSA